MLGVTTAMVNQAISLKEIKTTSKKLWKSIQAQSIVDRFAKKDDSENTDSTNECLAVLNIKVANKPTGYEFKSRDCNSAMDLGVDCSSNKIIYLERTTTGGTETLPEEWQDWTLPVLPSQCCSLFYERIIVEAKKPNSNIPPAIQTEITTVLALPASNRETEVRDVVHSIINHSPYLAHAKTICGDAHVDGAYLDCYQVVEDPTDPEYGKTRVGCPKKGETVTATGQQTEQPTLFGFNAGVSTTGRDNTFIGNQAGWTNTTGNQNTFVGGLAGKMNLTGIDNTFIGYRAGWKNTTGFYNTFIGTQTGWTNTNGHYNTFMGNQAGFYNEGSENTFIGYRAGVNNSTGRYNTFIGMQAGKDNSTGYKNTFMGNHAGWTNSTGKWNTFLGDQAGEWNTTGNQNTFVGEQAGKDNTTGHHNTFIGKQAGKDNTTGYRNTFMGNHAGWKNTEGMENTFLGIWTGKDNTTGSKNIFIGNRAGRSNTDGSNNISIGHQSHCSDFSICAVNDYVLNIGGLIRGHMPKRNVFGDIIAGNTPHAVIHGNLHVTGSFHLPSDRRLKTKIKSLTKNLSEFLKLEPKTYFWKNKSKSKKKQFGLIAQDVKKQYPELVSEDDTKFLGLNYTSFIPIIISAFKEFYGFVTNSLNSLTTQIADLKKSLQKEVSSLKKDNQQLKKDNQELKKTFQKDSKALQKDSKALQKEVSFLKKDNQELKKRMKALEKAFVQK